MTTITATGNFLARPNIHREIGEAIDYHWHAFDHTVLPMSGLWRATAYLYDGQETLDTATATKVGEIDIGPKPFHPPGRTVQPWVLIRKNRWHRIELIGKTIYLPGGGTVDVDEAEFWCCFSLRDPAGEVVEYQTGWETAFK